ncbi:XdhC family protein [Calothrix sp. NIES-3974]|uniref:XdhC family protein n=1 Tax=Calothrix sp. NIES-3974 TaxID=2005462 RepID=UPI000B61544D|nr:XdhC/CoxI family protein [Calothrix sp. NIES-3974]BAZ07189.1 putative xanthine dehydrogenase accessory factor [Calothrix sp. NIES-3974]
MNDFHAIIDTYTRSQTQGESCFLATIVNTQGSIYYRPGARMLITQTGNVAGVIGGGNIESEIIHHVQQWRFGDTPVTFAYDMHTLDDIACGFGIGNDGVVQVLLEPLKADSWLNPITFIAECWGAKQWGVLATVFTNNGIEYVTIGSRLTIGADGSATTDIKDIGLAERIEADARTVLSSRQSAVYRYQLREGMIDVFIEAIHPPLNLVIFGTGRDVEPVAKFAKALEWEVTIVDSQSQETTPHRFAKVDRVILTSRNRIREQVNLNENSFCVVMTHNYLDDVEILKFLLPSHARYIGILCAKHRCTRIINEICASGIIPTPNQLERLHAPIGLDIGADNPDAIALAIIAEIQAVNSKRQGGMLTNSSEITHKPYPIQISSNSQFNNLLMLER